MVKSTRGSTSRAKPATALPPTPIQQSSQANLDGLPAELINGVMEHLRPHDLTKLARVSTKYRDIAQSMLWRSIELHRHDAHYEPYGLSAQCNISRSHLDQGLVDPWSYRLHGDIDVEFGHHNPKFGTAVRKLFRTAGKSQAWIRLASYVQHLCLTVRPNQTPMAVWDMILSLPNLTSVEVIGECANNNQMPPYPAMIRTASAKKLRNVRLRGYIPTNFVVALCTASAATIMSLDLAVIELPREYTGDAEDINYPEDMGYPIYVAPCGILWLKQCTPSPFSSLTQLLLCKRGAFDGPPEMSEEEDMETREDEAHDLAELQQWASLLRSVRSTIVEVLLEQRPIYLTYLLYHDIEIKVNDTTHFCPFYSSFDRQFYRQILQGTFDDGKAWPKLKKLTLRGINLRRDEADEDSETLTTFADRVLPGVEVHDRPGNYMFFNTRSGTVMNRNGADGLKPQLDPPDVHFRDLEDDMFYF